MTKRSTGKFILGSLLGTLAGIVGGFLFAPKSGKAMRADIAKLAAKISQEMKSSADDIAKIAAGKYKEIRNAVAKKVAAVKTAGDDIDKEKYSMIVDDVVEEYKDDIQATKDGVKKIGNQLKKDWNKVKKAIT